MRLLSAAAASDSAYGNLVTFYQHLFAMAPLTVAAPLRAVGWSIAIARFADVHSVVSVHAFLFYYSRSLTSCSIIVVIGVHSCHPGLSKPGSCCCFRRLSLPGLVAGIAAALAVGIAFSFTLYSKVGAYALSQGL